jgi:hypothetical protein
LLDPKGVPCLLVVVTAFATAAARAPYRIERHEIEISAAVKAGHFGNEGFHLYESVLHLNGLRAGIRLGRSATDRDGSPPDTWGFDPSTVKLRWLDRDALLLISWSTFPQGQGAYSKEGTVIVSVAHGRPHEVFRDVVYAFGKAGMGNASASGLAVRYDSSRRALTLTQIQSDEWTSNEAGPLTDERWPTDGGDVFSSKSRTERSWRYRFEGTRLRPLSGEAVAVVDRPRAVASIAKGYGISLARLIALNPTLKGKRKAKGRLRIADRLGPYEPEMDDGICADPCP